jgi:hypothetical protein
MLLHLLFARWLGPRRYVWSPALDLADTRIYSTLLPGAHA